jgi:hypothetical protein
MQFKVDIARQEYVNKMGGSIGSAVGGESGIITSLTFTTSQGKTKTYGDPNNGTKFFVPLDNAGIFAFFASTSRTCLNAVGMYVQPCP